MDRLRLEAALAGVGVPDARRWAAVLAPAMGRHAITTDARAVSFLSNVLHETQGLTVFVENLNYSVEGLLRNFGRHRISEPDARRVGRVERAAVPGGRKAVVRPADKRAIANLLYGGEWGRLNLGNTQPDDGWYFRGRGLIQLTGRANHTRLARVLGVDVVALNALLDTDEGSAESAAHFFAAVGCNEVADAGDSEAVRAKINGGLKGHDDVLAWGHRLLAALPDPVVS